jgi:hypothetical protein
MWPKLARHLPTFASAVLTAIDRDGYPASVRCRPRLDPVAHTLWLDVPTAPELLPGPASLLCHSHDARLSRLRSCLVVGELQLGEGGWMLRPARFVPGVGIDGVLGGLRFVVQGRRTAARYLARRGLARPRVDWGELLAQLHAAAPG